MQVTALQGDKIERADVSLISDFQKSTTGEMAELGEDTTFQVNMVPIQSSYTRNVFVDSVISGQPVYDGGADERTGSGDAQRRKRSDGRSDC